MSTCQTFSVDDCTQLLQSLPLHDHQILEADRAWDHHYSVISGQPNFGRNEQPELYKNRGVTT
jgi:hypothetical protein